MVGIVTAIETGKGQKDGQRRIRIKVEKATDVWSTLSVPENEIVGNVELDSRIEVRLGVIPPEGWLGEQTPDDKKELSILEAHSREG